MTTSVRVRALAALVLSPLVGCGGDAPPTAFADGVVVNPAAPDRFFETRELWRIGALEEGPAAFGSIVGIGVGEGGEVIVADAQAGRLLLFDADGAFVRAIGQRGPGPDEFGQLMFGGLHQGRAFGLSFAGNGLRMLQFDLDGELVENWSMMSPEGRSLLPNWVDPSVSPSGWVTRVNEYPGFDAAETGDRVEGVVHFIAFTDTGEMGDTIVSVRNGALVKMNGGEGSPGRFFEPRPSTFLAPDGRVVVAEGDRYAFRVQDVSGDTLLSVRREVERIPVTGSHLDGIRSTVRAYYVERGFPLEQMERELNRLMPVTDTVPSIASVQPARGGGFWVRRGDIGDPVAIAVSQSYGIERPPVQYDHLDTSGRYVASWRPPEGFIPMLWSGDSVVGVALDEYDVSYAVRIAFEAPRD